VNNNAGNKITPTMSWSVHAVIFFTNLTLYRKPSQLSILKIRII